MLFEQRKTDAKKFQQTLDTLTAKHLISPEDNQQELSPEIEAVHEYLMQYRKELDMLYLKDELEAYRLARDDDSLIKKSDYLQQTQTKYGALKTTNLIVEMIFPILLGIFAISSAIWSAFIK